MSESIITFPFVQIANGLRYLSLSSSFGNIVAIILYGTICLLPIILLMLQRSKHKICYIDALLLLMSVLLFVVIYQLINPGLISNVAATKAFPCITLYSVIFTYVILKLIELFNGKSINKLCKYLILLLWAVNIVIAYSVLYTSTVSFGQSIKALQATNEGNHNMLGMTYAFMFLGMLVDIIPLLSNIVIVLFAILFVKSFSTDRYAEKTVMAAHKLSSVCKLSLIVTVLSAMIFNISQFLFASNLHQINSNISIPILSIIFALAILIFSQIISEGKELKDDNDSII